jgi:hypothetical protein
MERGEQATLLDVSTKQFDPYWVDPQQPLQVPNNPLHYAAHKYQLILARLDQQAVKNPAQFNSGNYIAIMEKLEKLWEKINGTADDEDLGQGNVAGGRLASAAAEDSEDELISMDS